MKFYVDINVIIDLLLMRAPYSEDAASLFNLATKQYLSLFTSSHCIATVHYVCKKNISEDLLRDLINDLLVFVKIVPVDENILKKSLKSNHKDFEDAIQIFCAHQIDSMDGIITRNLKDFSTSEIPVFSPNDALNVIHKNLNK